MAAVTSVLGSVAKVSDFVSGTNVVVYNRPWKSRDRIKPFIIAKGVITERPIDGKQFVLGNAEVTANLTASRKEVKIQQLISIEAIIPTINKYYRAETKIQEIFDLRYCFCCKPIC